MISPRLTGYTMQAPFRTTMTFSESDSSPTIPGVPSTSPADTDLNYAHSALSQLVRQPEEDDSTCRAKLGLRDSGKITLDIISGAQRARSHRKACIFIAEQAYQLVNAVDAGVKGGVLDINIVLREHVARLNVDLNQIRQTIRRLGSWWIFPCMWSAEKELARCRDILERGMDTYVLLLKCSLAQPDEMQTETSFRETPPSSPS